MKKKTKKKKNRKPTLEERRAYFDKMVESYKEISENKIGTTNEICIKLMCASFYIGLGKRKIILRR